jgi:hypothetical protein
MTLRVGVTMNEVRKVTVAGKPYLAVLTHSAVGWRAAGLFGERTIVVEPFASSDEALLAWQLEALFVQMQQAASRSRERVDAFRSRTKNPQGPSRQPHEGADGNG